MTGAREWQISRCSGELRSPNSRPVVIPWTGIAAVERRYLHGKGIIRRRADGVAGWFVAVSKMTGVESSETYRPNSGVPARFGRRPPLVRQASVLSARGVDVFAIISVSLFFELFKKWAGT